MPTYEYRCNGCQREFEIQQKMSDDDLVHCDVCGQDKLEKLISWTSVRGSSHHDALFSANPREAMKGTAAVDRSRPPKKETPAVPATPALQATPATPAASATPAPDVATAAPVATPAANDTASVPASPADEGEEPTP